MHHVVIDLGAVRHGRLVRVYRPAPRFMATEFCPREPSQLSQDPTYPAAGRRDRSFDIADIAAKDDEDADAIFPVVMGI